MVGDTRADGCFSCSLGTGRLIAENGPETESMVRRERRACPFAQPCEIRRSVERFRR
jgi:hypothetical protein